MRLAERERLLERGAQPLRVEGLGGREQGDSGRSFTREFGRARGIVYACSFSAMCVSIG
ncbi:MAG: hypothetical protein RL385_3110 [Pseudomonadota bacterium]|jgi:hypothetical protein